MDLNRLAETFGSERTPLIRTDFSDDTAWNLVMAEVTKLVDFGSEDPDADPDYDGYTPNVTPIDDRAFAGVTGETLARAFIATDETYGYAILVDARSMAEARAGGELTVVYVDLSVADPADAELFPTFRGRNFRCAVSEFASNGGNLSIANMDFHEFADNTNADGVFRGFNDGEEVSVNARDQSGGARGADAGHRVVAARSSS